MKKFLNNVWFWKNKRLKNQPEIFLFWLGLKRPVDLESIFPLEENSANWSALGLKKFKRGLSFGITWKWLMETISIRCAGKQFHEPEAQGVVLCYRIETFTSVDLGVDC